MSMAIDPNKAGGKIYNDINEFVTEGRKLNEMIKNNFTGRRVYLEHMQEKITLKEYEEFINNVKSTREFLDALRSMLIKQTENITT